MTKGSKWQLIPTAEKGKEVKAVKEKNVRRYVGVEGKEGIWREGRRQDKGVVMMGGKTCVR